MTALRASGPPKPKGLPQYGSYSVYRVGGGATRVDRRIGEEGVTSMPTPRPPSLTSILASQVELTPPVCDWIQALKTEEEMIRLLLTIRGIPTSWLDRAAKTTKDVEKHKGPIQQIRATV